MGSYFRKSIRLGPFRLNLSRSGAGASLGVRGARLTFTPQGATYVTVGNDGFYYREALPRDNSPSDAVPTQNLTPEEIPSAEVAQLVDSSNERLVGQLNERSRKGNPAILLYSIAGILMVVGLATSASTDDATKIVELGAATAALALGVVLHQDNRARRTTRLFYRLDVVQQRKHANVNEALDHIARCDRIWRIEAKSPTNDWKRNAGASSLVHRTTVTVGQALPPRVKSNIPVKFLNLGVLQLFFFPDMILCQEGARFGAISYEGFRVQHLLTRLIEDEYVPGDSLQVDTTWRYVNKNGGPDRRFNNNRQIPILQYGEIAFTSATGLNVLLNASSSQMSLAFAAAWQAVPSGGPKASGGSKHRQPPHPPPEERQRRQSAPPPPRQTSSPFDHAAARNILGVSATASAAEVSAAYRHMAQMYHPDKVAALGPEFGDLAEQKMREINAAYEMLKT